MDNETCIIIKHPKDCTEEEIIHFHNFVQSTAQVSTNNLMARIKTTAYLGFYYLENKLIGITALKNPKIAYKEKIFMKAGIPGLAAKYKYELGYAVTLPEYRKQGSAINLAKEIFKKIPLNNIYATIKTTNLQAQSILRKLNFKKIGDPYQGKSDLFQIFGFDLE